MPFVYHCEKIKIFPFRLLINMVALGCVSNSTNSCTTILLHTSVFSGSSKISNDLYYSTENCMLTFGKIGVACYFWMALYILQPATDYLLLYLQSVLVNPVFDNPLLRATLHKITAKCEQMSKLLYKLIQ